jgi:hypothetical protein
MGRNKGKVTAESSNGEQVREEAPKTPRAPRVKRTLSQQLTELHALKQKEVDRLRKREAGLRDDYRNAERELRFAEAELEQLRKAAGIEEDRGEPVRVGANA